MKLRLPFSLLSAVLAVFTIAASGAHAVVVPEGYDSYYLTDPDVLYDFRGGNQNVAFLLDGGVTFSSESASWWVGTSPLKSGGSVLFTIEEDSDPWAISFKACAGYPAFYNVSTLSFREVGNVSFQNIGTEGNSYGAIYNVSTVDISNSRVVEFSGNRSADSSGKSSGASGGAIYGSSINLNENRQISFVDNYVYSFWSNNSDYSIISRGGAIFGTSNSIINVNGNERSVTFRGNGVEGRNNLNHYSGVAYGYGGALCVDAHSVINICGNLGDVTFEDNYASAYANYSINHAYAKGGAIYANTSVINLLDNHGIITFKGNYLTADTYKQYSGLGTNVDGGAICLNSGSLNVRGNLNEVIFSENNAYCGGALYASNSDVNLEATTGNIEFKANSAQEGGAVYSSSSTTNLHAVGGNIIFENNTATYGGAIYGENINICNNTGEVSFVDNAANSGGAIYDTSSVINICNNTGKVSFSGNTAQTGAAIYGGSLVIQNNESVVFERNLEHSGRLRSIYLSNTLADGGKFHVSAAAGKSMTFTDGIYVSTTTIGKSVDVVFNGSYIASDESEIAQGGDIIFDGGQVEGVLRELLGTAPTAKQMAESRTSYVGSITNLNAGRLIIRNGAQYNGLGIATTARSGAAVVLENAGMDHSLGSINMRRGTSLELSGCNQIVADGLTLSSGSTLGFTVGTEQRETASLSLNANLAHFSITIALDGADMLASGRYKLVELADVSQYTSDDYWTADDITVTATGDAAGLGFDDLVWEDGVLYVEQGKSIWNNAAGDGVWNTASVNWVRNDVGIAYKNGMDVSFTDAAAGIVKLEGDIAAADIIVNNTSGNDYTFTAAEGGGRLTGAGTLTKQGSGGLTLDTANDYTGATNLEGGTLHVHHSTALGATADGGASVTTAAGTTLKLGNNSHLVLGGTHSLAGAVDVEAGSTLEMRSNGYAAESSLVNGTLKFKDAAADTGSLSGSGTVHVVDSQVTVESLSSFTGNLELEGKEASLSIGSGSYSAAGTLRVAGGQLTFGSKANITLNAGGQLLLSALDGAAARLTANNINIRKGATLASDIQASVSPLGDTPVLSSREVGAELNCSILTLNMGAALDAEDAYFDLNNGTLVLAVTKTGTEKINLILAEHTVYTGSEQIVLFANAGKVTFIYNNITATNADGSTYTLNAADYFTGTGINESTQLVYDSTTGTLYLQGVEAIPEPATATLSLLALASLVIRRRRK